MSSIELKGGKSMNKKTIKTLIISALSIPIALGIAGISATVASGVKAYTILEDSYFTYTNGNNVFNCYNIDGQANKIAVAWGGEPSATPNDNLTVPETITHQGVSYTVSVIAKAAFRYCDFATITLPNTIEEIHEEAFAYCENMTSFTLPYQVNEIAPSTFLDCRSLISFLYSDSTGAAVVANNAVTRIGDHAFDTCISLVSFECPNTLVYIGQSAFQRCRALTRIFLPSKRVTNSVITNNLTIESYAFADCDNLAWVYFEENLQTVGDYAFVNCNEDLRFHYAYDGATRPDPTFSTYWRRVFLDTSKTDIYPIDTTTHVVIYQTDNYPGLRYTIQSSAIYLDCQTKNPKTIKIDNGGSDYAVVYQWEPPTTTIPNYYNVDTGALTIPGELRYNGNDYPLKIIQAETFRGKTEITSVKFCDGIVQICFRAFYGCTNISSLDFTECTTLKEIGNCLFTDIATNSVEMTKVTSLTIPNTVEYIGKYAFYNFVNLSSLSFKTVESDPSNIKVLGGYAFGNVGRNHRTALIDVELPCSLSDAVAKEAMINQTSKSDPRMKNDTSLDDYNTVNWAAVGPYAFGGRNGDSPEQTDATAVRVVSMDEPTAAQLSDDTYICSIASNAFNRAWYMTRFVANENLCLLGCDAFKNCINLKEAYLTTRKAQAYVTRTGYKYPWGAKKDEAVNEGGKTPENSVFTTSITDVVPDLVIYVDGDAPGDIDNMSIDKGCNTWNTDYIAKSTTQPFVNDLCLGAKEHTSSRTTYPTYYNVDFDNVLYWRPKLNNDTPGVFLTGSDIPDDISDYNSGVISFVKEGNKYSLTKYYCDGTQNNNTVRQEIDLTGVSDNSVNVSANLTKIGNGAFATNGTSIIPGLYFILPDSIVEIGERAFYRKDGSKVHTNGARIVTYKSGNTIMAPTGSTYEGRKGANPGYCMLPNGLTTIKLDAFYNNYFDSVELPATLTHLGGGAFYTHTASLNVKSRLATITIATNSNFASANNGIYYIGDANKKTLVSQAQYDSNASLTIASGTKAIGFMACANTSYTTITLNTELTHIYGSGFQRNLKLTTVNVPTGSQLKYISARATSNSDEIWVSNLSYDSSLPVSIVDYRAWLNKSLRINRSRNSAFRDCSALTTMNFKNLTNLEKIGSAAFKSCSNLEHLAGGQSYSYYTYTSGTTLTLKETKNSGVLDLTSCTQLRVIHKGAFVGCNKIKYVELPATDGQLYIGQVKEGGAEELAYTIDNQFINATNNVTILFNDTASKACYYSTSPTSTAKNHIASGVLGTLSVGTANHNTAYYYMSSASDIVGTGGNNESVNYWTKVNGKYILIQGPTAAAAFWTNYSNIDFTV